MMSDKITCKIEFTPEQFISVLENLPPGWEISEPVFEDGEFIYNMYIRDEKK